MTDWVRALALVSIVFYFIFDFLDGRRVVDEREELIRLKALELAHKASMLTLSLLAIAYIFYPSLNTLGVIFCLVFASLYTEILGKLFYRWKI